jgi:hypothetical protein
MPVLNCLPLSSPMALWACPGSIPGTDLSYYTRPLSSHHVYNLPFSQCCDQSFIHQIYNITNNTHALTLTLTHTHTSLTVTDWLLRSQSQSQSQSYVMTDGQSVSMPWCQVHSGTRDQILHSVWKLLCCLCGAPSMTRGRVCLLSVTFISV